MTKAALREHPAPLRHFPSPEMLKALLLAIVTIFILSVFRMIAGALSKGFSEMTGGGSEGPQPGRTPPPPPRPAASATGGALRRDPVCGMFIPEASAVTKSVKGETLYFCSPECRDRHKA
jgi:YHS domain-containing protein